MDKSAPYTAQIWHGVERILQVQHLSLDAAREICRTAPMTGHSGRVWCETEDYTEVFASDGSVRCGPYAETTLIITA